MSLDESSCRRNLKLFFAKLNPIDSSTYLYKNSNDIKIKDIPKLNKYFSIKNINFEIYNIFNNKLIDYYINDKLELSKEYTSIIKEILIAANLKECDIYIFYIAIFNKSIIIHTCYTTYITLPQAYRATV